LWSGKKKPGVLVKRHKVPNRKGQNVNKRELRTKICHLYPKILEPVGDKKMNRARHAGRNSGRNKKMWKKKESRG